MERAINSIRGPGFAFRKLPRIGCYLRERQGIRDRHKGGAIVYQVHPDNEGRWILYQVGDGGFDLVAWFADREDAGFAKHAFEKRAPLALAEARRSLTLPKHWPNDVSAVWMIRDLQLASPTAVRVISHKPLMQNGHLMLSAGKIDRTGGAGVFCRRVGDKTTPLALGHQVFQHGLVVEPAQLSPHLSSSHPVANTRLLPR